VVPPPSVTPFADDRYQPLVPTPSSTFSLIVVPSDSPPLERLLRTRPLDLRRWYRLGGRQRRLLQRRRLLRVLPWNRLSRASIDAVERRLLANPSSPAGTIRSGLDYPVMRTVLTLNL